MLLQELMEDRISDNNFKRLLLACSIHLIMFKEVLQREKELYGSYLAHINKYLLGGELKEKRNAARILELNKPSYREFCDSGYETKKKFFAGYPMEIFFHDLVFMKYDELMTNPKQMVYKSEAFEREKALFIEKLDEAKNPVNNKIDIDSDVFDKFCLVYKKMIKPGRKPAKKISVKRAEKDKLPFLEAISAIDEFCCSCVYSSKIGSAQAERIFETLRVIKEVYDKDSNGNKRSKESSEMTELAL